MKDVTKDLAHRAKRHEFQGGQQKQNLDRDYKNWHGPTGSGKRWDLASPGKRKAAADRTQAIVTAHKKAKKAANHALQTIQKHGPHHAASKAAVAKYNAANDHVANLPEHYSMTESTQNPSHWHALAKNHADQANHHSDQAKKHDTSYISGDATIVHPMRARAEASHKGARDTHQDAGAAAKKVAHAIEKHGNDHPTTKRLKGQYGDEHHLAKKQSQEAREASAKLGAHNQRRDANRYNESVEIDEAHAYSKAAKALQDYGSKSGGIDKKDFHIAAKHLDNIGKAGLMQKGDHLAKFNRHLKDLDTDVRDRIHMTLKQHGVMESVQEAKVKLKGFGPDHAKGNMGNPAARAALGKRMADNEKARQALKDPSHNPAWANSKSKTEETVSELKKSTLGSYVNKASRDAASKAYGAASAAKDNRADQAGKDFSKSMKRLKGVETATRKMAKEDIDEAKSFDQKFKDHLKFATSKSKAVQDYMAKRKAKRDDAHAKQDPAAVKKNYGPAVIPPGTAYNKARKKGMNPSAAADAVSTAFKNRAKGRKLPEGKIEEAAQFKVDIEGLPPTFIQGKSSAEILANLRKIVKQPSLIKNVERYTDMEVKKAYRQKAQGRPMGEAIDSTDTGGAEETKMAMKQIKAMRHFLDGIEQRVGNQGDMEEWYQNKLTKANDYLKSLYAYGKGDEEV
jgi:hypothetical protein